MNLCTILNVWKEPDEVEVEGAPPAQENDQQPRRQADANEIQGRILTGGAPVDRVIVNKDKQAQKLAAQKERKAAAARRNSELSKKRRLEYDKMTDEEKEAHDADAAAKRAKNAASLAQAQGVPGALMNSENPEHLQLREGARRSRQPSIQSLLAIAKP